MRVLALEPYFGGSHRRFIEGWIAHSRHRWTLLTLPARKWKWRMRHGAVSLGFEVERRAAAGERWDLVLCSDMLNLAEWKGLLPPALRRLPAVAYFHENQLTYPVRFPKERDYQFGMTNVTSALAASEVWFNSAFHRDDFLDAIPRFLKAMPDHRPYEVVKRIRAASRVEPPAIEGVAPRRRARPEGALRVAWAARWEFDKAPEVLFEAARRLAGRGVDFRLSVLGQRYEEVPPVFARAREELAEQIDHWGYCESREAYSRILGAADVFVSTAIHEFFGLAVIEAVAAGACPLLPERLAYPEVLDLRRHPERRLFFYDGGVEELCERLGEMAEDPSSVAVRPELAALRRRVERFSWPAAAPRLDRALEKVALESPG